MTSVITIRPLAHRHLRLSLASARSPPWMTAPSGKWEHLRSNTGMRIMTAAPRAVPRGWRAPPLRSSTIYAASRLISIHTGRPPPLPSPLPQVCGRNNRQHRGVEPRCTATCTQCTNTNHTFIATRKTRGRRWLHSASSPLLLLLCCPVARNYILWRGARPKILRPFSSVLRAAQKSNMRASATSCSRPITHKTLCAAEMEWHRSMR